MDYGSSLMIYSMNQEFQKQGFPSKSTCILCKTASNNFCSTVNLFFVLLGAQQPIGTSSTGAVILNGGRQPPIGTPAQNSSSAELRNLLNLTDAVSTESTNNNTTTSNNKSLDKDPFARVNLSLPPLSISAVPQPYPMNFQSYNATYNSTPNTYCNPTSNTTSYSNPNSYRNLVDCPSDPISSNNTVFDSPYSNVVDVLSDMAHKLTFNSSNGSSCSTCAYQYSANGSSNNLS